MGAGEFDRRIRIEQPVEDQDSSGDLTVSWSLFAERWAELLPAGGSESFGSGQRSASQTVQFRIRHLADVTPKMTILWHGKRYKIENVGEPDRNRTIVLSCVVLENQSGTAS